jgi:replicative DNA helicase
MRRGTFSQIDYSQMDSAMAKLCKLPIYIEDKLMKPDQLYAKAMRIKREHGTIDLITQDYAQLMTRFCKRGGVEEMDAMMMEYKEMAKDLGCTTLILSQFNTESQKENTPPVLKDLKGSGGIVASADWVLLLHRPDKKKYGREEAYCYVAKARFGSPQRLDMAFIPQCATWLDSSEQQ